jgi:hypothetical protein
MGNTPDELEADAISQAAEQLGVEPALLAVQPGYTIYRTPAPGTPDSQLGYTAMKARDRGLEAGRLYASPSIAWPLAERKLAVEVGSMPPESAYEDYIAFIRPGDPPVILMRDGVSFAEVRPVAPPRAEPWRESLPPA